MEYYQDSFDVIRRHTARGVIVVEAAGNGTQNLDAELYGGRFNPAIRHSGALLIGASGAGDNRPNNSSNTTRRIDLHAWGTGVVTIGANPPDYREDPLNRAYRQSFGGTSSASAIVTGAVCSLQGIQRSAGRPPLTPVEMREVLHSTGTPQQGDATEQRLRPLGRQPNLRAAIENVEQFSGGFHGAGVYVIRSVHSGKVMDIDLNWFQGQQDGQVLLQNDYHGGLNQQFEFIATGGGAFLIAPRHTRGKVLEVAGGSTANGARVQQWRQTGGGNQRFLVEREGSSWRFVATHSGKVLDVEGVRRDSGARIHQWAWVNGANQRWELLPIRLFTAP